ncbi:MGMT family protein [Slackia heliotrinireducens]|uniref:MGMT family protein n=1 Tax=Slackia heliotrinireducens TaxID=84110 RepID=UPI00331459C7
MGEFNDAVFEQVKRIPRGKVSTYGQLARLIGRPRSARYVGWALRTNDQPVVIPCHRVVFKDGKLAEGYIFGGDGVQRKLLQDEGVVFVDDDHVDMDACLWNPAEDGLPGRPADIDWAREMDEGSKGERA